MKDEFVAVVSHELRTPLTPILGWAKMLQSEVPELDRHKAGKVIERNVQLQTKVIDDLLDVSRIISGKLQFKMKPFKLSQAVNAAVDTIRPAAHAKEIDVQVQLHSDPEIFGDAGRIQQAIWNVLGNAIKFTLQKGRIQISMDSVGNCAEVTIEDSGEGIEPQFLKTIFKRFAQVDSSSTRLHGGLGLGLSIVQHIVEAHAGRISASSPGKGKGATFKIQIPIEAAPSTIIGEKKGAQTRRETPSIQGTSVLLVEDDQDSLEVISSALTCAGATVSCASSAQDARGFLERTRPDVIVSDIGMPEEDGYSFIRKLRCLPLELGGQIPAVALTSFAKEEDRMAAFSAGFQKHMAKPVDLSELVEVVATVVKSAGEQRGAQATE
jgi:CheY-like chemotaxis protein/anti-sigma regulatory factor (Ser/Thr protein kinase)